MRMLCFWQLTDITYVTDTSNHVIMLTIYFDTMILTLRRKSALRCWRDRLGRRATYEELMKIFHSRQDIRMVEELGNLLCA